MKVVETDVQSEQVQFPWIGKKEDKSRISPGRIVLFLTSTKGIVLKPGRNDSLAVGESDTFCIRHYEPVSVVLSNN